MLRWLLLTGDKAQRSSTGVRSSPFAVEKERAYRVWLQFAALVAALLVGVWLPLVVIVLLVAGHFGRGDIAGSWVFWRGLLIVTALTLLVAVAHWFLSRRGARRRLLRALQATPPTPGDRYHDRLANIVAEMRLATGTPGIECVVVPTLGFNAFAFSDFSGGAVIGVTEGALARLSRQQLQAIVAHEFASILSGSCHTATISCLLFGIYDDLREGLQEGAVDSTDISEASLVLGVTAVWLWVVSRAARLCEAALNRDRESLADVAAARYTRDPLSLAEALAVIGDHPGGAGRLPDGLAPLCVRGANGDADRARRDWHAALQVRIVALLKLANVSPVDFRAQLREAQERSTRREHWASAPCSGEPQITATPDVVAAPSAPAGGSAAPAGSAAEVVARAAPAAAAVPMSSAATQLVTGPAPGAWGACPTCGANLRPIDYEGLTIGACAACGGRLVDAAALRRILARREMGFSAEQLQLAEEIMRQGDERRRAARAGTVAGVSRACPRCGAIMLHRHFSYDFALDVERCVICDLVWFDRDELEALQVLTESQVN